MADADSSIVNSSHGSGACMLIIKLLHSSGVQHVQRSCNHIPQGGEDGNLEAPFLA